MATLKQIPGQPLLESLRALYERGLTLDTLKRAEEFAPLKEWDGIPGCVLASRLAANMGAPRLASRFNIRTWRIDRNDLAARLQYAFEVAEKRGSLAVWTLMRDWPVVTGGTPEDQAELLALQARVTGELRDFALAEKLITRAEALKSDGPWVRLQRSHILEQQDRIEESLEAARAAMAVHRHPYYRPGVQTVAHLLQLLDRDEEAIEFLQAAGQVLQSSPVAAQLYSLLTENRRWSEAEATLERCVALAPLAEPGFRKWVDIQRARVAYHLGNRVEAARRAAEQDDDFHKQFSARLAAPPVEPERVQLDVTFVRQHFKTCAPATLAAIGRYWRLPSEHLQLAEAMCYDGTPHWQQRRWAEGNGWIVHEFRVTQELAVELISRGIPFAIATVEATSAHMQAVAGFDRTRGTLLLRDPGQPYIVEAIAEPFFKRYRPFGPHGMIFLPVAEQHRLDGLDLLETGLYDAHHRVCLALAEHDRAAAAAILQEMESASPDEALTWETRLHLTGYDAQNTERTRALDHLLGMFPNNATRLLSRLGTLRDAPRDEQIKFLEQACAVPGADAMLFIELARRLKEDARSVPQARHWLKRAARFRRMDSTAMRLQADMLWEEGHLEPATDLYRFAANIESFREDLYQSWFIACRRTRRTDEALAYLEDRFKRFGARSGQPALTLAWAWREMEQPRRAREILAEASRLRPEDGYLLLRAASVAASLHETDEVNRLLETARGKVRENDWLRAAAEQAERRLEYESAWQWSRELLEREPLALDAHGRLARALAQLKGTAAALEHLKNARDRFPHHYTLQRMIVDWSRDGDPAAWEAAVRELLQIDATDAWACRELALALAKQNRPEEALRAAEEGAGIEPHNSYSFSVLGQVHRRRQAPAEARVQLRRAVTLSVDNRDALHALLELAETDKERKEELALIEQELIRQVVTGDGLLVYLELARPVLDAARLLQSLQQAHRERPDLWHAWAALISQLGHLHRLDEALIMAKQAVERFAHLPRIHLELAIVQRWRQDLAGEIATAQNAFEMSPGWSRAAFALGDAFERSNRLEEAQAVYERALQHAPENAALHGRLAHVLWRRRQRDAAFAEIERALRLSPAYDWAWNCLSAWANDTGEIKRPADFARKLTEERPGDQSVRLTLARTSDDAAERLAAVEQAIQLDPRLMEAWDLKADLLARAERFEEAIQACHDGIAACGTEMHVLRGRQAWVEHHRRRVPEAIQLMRAVLAENFNYVWGWTQLAHWLIGQKSYEEAATALEQLVRLRPHDAWVNRELGGLRLKQKDRANAQKSFAAALRLAPADVQAAHELLKLQMQSADIAGARATLQVMQTHQPGAATLAAEISLQLRQRENQAAAKSLEALCVSPDTDAWPLDSAAAAFRQAAQSGRALKIFKRALKKSAAHPQIATAAIHILLEKKSFFSAIRLFLGLPPGENQRRAGAPLVNGLAKAKKRLFLGWLLRQRHAVLAADDAAWGQVGFALSNLNQMKKVAAWLADWERRPNVQPWMLFNLCLALRSLGRYDEATTLARHVLTTWGHRDGAADLRLFLAVEEALTGNLPDAVEQLQSVTVRKNVSYDQQLLALAKALVEFRQTAPGERVKQFKVIRHQLSDQFNPAHLARMSQDVRRTFGRAGQLFINEGGGWRARMWFGWRVGGSTVRSLLRFGRE